MLGIVTTPICRNNNVKDDIIKGVYVKYASRCAADNVRENGSVNDNDFLRFKHMA